MRKVILKRKRAYVGCLVGLNVYRTTSRQEADTTIDGYPVKHVCKLKNGKIAEFEIPDIACIIYVRFPDLMDSTTKYFIGEGTEDVYLLTKPHMGWVDTKFSIEPMDEKTKLKCKTPR